MNTNKVLLAVTLGLSSAGISHAEADLEGFAAFYADIAGKTDAKTTETTPALEAQQSTEKLTINTEDSLATRINNHVASKKETDSLHSDLNEATVKGDLGTSSRLDGLYIQNIPQTSAVSFNDKLQILPYNSELVFFEGKRVYNKSDLPKGDSFTRCSLMFRDYGVGRNIKKGQDFLITQVAADKTPFAFDKSKDRQEVVLKLDNEHLKMIYCESTEKETPFTIGDLKYQFGGIIDFKLRDFIDI